MLHAKKNIAVFIFVISFQFLSAQTNYISHTLKQGESLSMLATQYNTSVGDIMRMNGMHADTKLVYGSQIKIPSTKNQAEVVKKSSSTTINTAPVATPSNEITHVVAKGETLYSIGKKYNISVEQIKAWNHLADDNAKMGTLLIISDNGINKPVTTPSQKQRVETVEAAEQKNEPAIDSATIKQDVGTDNNPAKTQPVLQTENNINTLVADQPATDYSGQGYFASEFKERKTKKMQDIPGISKIFKTTSGWTDGKYYILADNIEPGTIVKITADNGNAVYAKVLWGMGDMKENAGINFRVSNATAAALHENEPSFNVSLSF